MAHDLKIGEKVFQDVDKITIKNTDGNAVEFIAPYIEDEIEANGWHDVKDWTRAYVNVPTSGGSVDLSQYVKKEDTWNYTDNTKFKYGPYEPQSNILICDVEITVGFKPKIFMIRSYSGISNSSTTYVACSWFVSDNNYTIPTNCKIDFQKEGEADFSAKTASTQTVTSGKGGASQSSVNILQATSSGVAGKKKIDSSADVSGCNTYFQGGQLYIWFAWG